MAFVIEAPEPHSLPVLGSDESFPVRRVYCVGRNYADHAREMGHDPDREPPFFFMKPAEAVVACPPGSVAVVAYPTQTANLHHEVELAVAIGARAAAVSPAEALDAVWGYGVAVDLTRRDMQDEAKALRRPWDLSKGFDESAPISALVPASAVGHPAAGRITVAVDGTTRQDGDLNQQIWTVPEVIAALSQAITLLPGDIILTGTPSGVGPIECGQTVTGSIDGIGTIAFGVE
ncbi:fumarylacetoacetate hydrolase family protein [Microbacterium mitrae]|uniref:Fumarylacetoacetate hydrolase family protein n=1 Tax=Microbacterium mitrae TaxID=664640 RepID=A0A5C8HM75_9MICO|nr:fumarylacetoacetate hydrolase family protein [Microbacterium mitrae]TXK03507.1 fumarylacetoacetate hydrolase family protein [Microbacterium mitrae]